MAVSELLREIEDRGVTLVAAPVEPRLRFRPASRLTPELVEGLRLHKAAILERLEGPTVRDEAEVFGMALARLGGVEHPEEPPYPEPAPGRDPMAHKHTDKACYFAGARRRELERRQRNGLPPWIRLVGGGGDAA